MEMHRISRSAYAGKLLEFPELAHGGSEAAHRRGRWSELFGDRIGDAFAGRIVLEIGCFDAAFLTRIASKNPTVAFIGLDWKCKPLYDGAAQIYAAGLKNIQLLRARAQDVRQFFGDGEIDQAWIFHPDPCDKEKELKNRLISEPFLVDLHAVLRQGSHVAIKTDHPGYYQWLLGLLGVQHPFHDPSQLRRRRDLMREEQIPVASDLVRQRFEMHVRSDDLRNDAEVQSRIADRLFANETTLFERRFIRKRLPIYYLELIAHLSLSR